jgi:hypothetical protein
MRDLLNVLKGFASMKGGDVDAMYDSPYVRFKKMEGDRLFDAWQLIKNAETVEIGQLAEAVKILFLVNYSQEVVGMNTYPEEVTDDRDKEVAGIVEAAWEEYYVPYLGELADLIKLIGQKVGNTDRYPGAEWLDTVKPIGSVGGSTMFLVGYEVPNGTEYPLVAVDRGGQLWATPLWELQGHSQDKIVITEEL